MELREFIFTVKNKENVRKFNIMHQDLMAFFDVIFDMNTNTFQLQFRNEKRVMNKIIFKELSIYLDTLKGDSTIDVEFLEDNITTSLYKDLPVSRGEYFLKYENENFVERLKLYYEKEGDVTNEEVQKLY